MGRKNSTYFLMLLTLRCYVLLLAANGLMESHLVCVCVCVCVVRLFTCLILKCKSFLCVLYIFALSFIIEMNSRGKNASANLIEVATQILYVRQHSKFSSDVKTRK